MKSQISEKQNNKSEPISDMTKMAIDRTVMAADRSLMAWVRTGLSLISFGFTIYKFLQNSTEQHVLSGNFVNQMSSPRLVGLFMVGMGILSLIFGILENRAVLKELKIKFSISQIRYSLIMAAILLVFGTIIFLGIVLRFKGMG